MVLSGLAVFGLTSCAFRLRWQIGIALGCSEGQHLQQVCTQSWADCSLPSQEDLWTPMLRKRTAAVGEIACVGVPRLQPCTSATFTRTSRRRRCLPEIRYKISVEKSLKELSCKVALYQTVPMMVYVD